MNNNSEVVNIDRRISERRIFRCLSRIQLNTRDEGCVFNERRQQPCRRYKSIAAREVSYLEYVAAVIRSGGC